MTIERLKKILKCSKEHENDINEYIKNFSHQVDFENINGVRELLQIVRPVLQQKNYKIIELPLVDKEIGAFIYRGDKLSYLVINSSVPVVNANFALCHELFHIFFQPNTTKNTADIEFDYFENDSEEIANLFAGNLLMPKDSFSKLFKKFTTLCNGDEIDIIVSLMNYFKAPFMAVFIRCYELGLFTKNTVDDYFFNIKSSELEGRFEKFWYDSSILKPSNNDDSERLKKLVHDYGTEYVQNDYIKQKTLTEVMNNLDLLLKKIKAAN